MTASTFQAVDPTTGSAFGDPITEMSASDVSGLISKAVATKSSFAATSPKERAAILRAIGREIEARREKLIEVGIEIKELSKQEYKSLKDKITEKRSRGLAPAKTAGVQFEPTVNGVVFAIQNQLGDLR